MEEQPDPEVTKSGDDTEDGRSILRTHNAEEGKSEVGSCQEHPSDDTAQERGEQPEVVDIVRSARDNNQGCDALSTERVADTGVEGRSIFPSPKVLGDDIRGEAELNSSSYTPQSGAASMRDERDEREEATWVSNSNSTPGTSVISESRTILSAVRSPSTSTVVSAETARNDPFGRLGTKTSALSLVATAPSSEGTSTPPSGAVGTTLSTWHRRGAAGRPVSLPSRAPPPQPQPLHPQSLSSATTLLPPPPPQAPQLCVSAAAPRDTDGCVVWYTDDSAAEADIESMASVASVDSREDDLEAAASTDSEVASTASSTGGASSVCSDSSRSRAGDRESRWNEEGEEDVLLGLSLALARETAGKPPCSCRQSVCSCRWKSSASSRGLARPSPLPLPLARAPLDSRDLALVAEINRMTRGYEDLEGVNGGGRTGTTRVAPVSSSTTTSTTATTTTAAVAAAAAAAAAAGLGGGGMRGVHPDRALEFADRFVRRDISLAGRAQAVRLLKMSTYAILRVVARRGGLRALYGWLVDVWERVRAHKLPRAGPPDWRGVGGRLYVEDLLGVLTRVPISVDMLRETEIARVAKKFRRLAERHGIESMTAASNRLRAHLHAVVSRGVQEGLFFRNRVVGRHSSSTAVASSGGPSGGLKGDRYPAPFQQIGRSRPEPWQSKSSWRPGLSSKSLGSGVGAHVRVPGFVSANLGNSGPEISRKVGDRGRGDDDEGDVGGRSRDDRKEGEIEIEGGSSRQTQAGIGNAGPYVGHRPRSSGLDEATRARNFRSVGFDEDLQGWRRRRGDVGADDVQLQRGEHLGGPRLRVSGEGALDSLSRPRSIRINSPRTSAFVGGGDDALRPEAPSGHADAEEGDAVGDYKDRELFLTYGSRSGQGGLLLDPSGREYTRHAGSWRRGGEPKDSGSSRRNHRYRGITKTEPFVLDFSRRVSESDRRARVGGRRTLFRSPGRGGSGPYRWSGDGSPSRGLRGDDGKGSDMSEAGVGGDEDGAEVSRSSSLGGERTARSLGKSSGAHWQSSNRLRSERLRNISEDWFVEDGADWWARSRYLSTAGVDDPRLEEHVFAGPGSEMRYAWSRRSSWTRWQLNPPAPASSLPTVPTFEESGTKVTWADLRGLRLAEVHEIEPGYSREDFALPGRVGFSTERRDMSKKEEQLLSQEDHDRLAAAALESSLVEGGYGGAGGGGGDSEGTISDSENSTTGEPDNDNLGPVEDESRAASPARDAGAGLEPAKDPEGDDAVGKTDVKSGGFEEVKADDEAPEDEEDEDSSAARAGTRSSVDRPMVDGGCGTGDEADDSESGRRGSPCSGAGVDANESPSRRSKRDAASDEGSESCSSLTGPRSIFSAIESETPPGSPSVSSPARRSPSPMETRSSPGSPEISSPGSSRSGSLINENVVFVPTVPSPLKRAVYYPMSVLPDQDRFSEFSRTLRPWRQNDDDRELHRRRLVVGNIPGEGDGDTDPTVALVSMSAMKAQRNRRGRVPVQDRGDDSGDASDVSGGGGSGSHGDGSEARQGSLWEESASSVASDLRWGVGHGAGSGRRGGSGRRVSERGGVGREGVTGRRGGFVTRSNRLHGAFLDTVRERRVCQSRAHGEEGEENGGGELDEGNGDMGERVQAPVLDPRGNGDEDARAYELHRDAEEGEEEGGYPGRAGDRDIEERSRSPGAIRLEGASIAKITVPPPLSSSRSASISAKNSGAGAGRSGESRGNDRTTPLSCEGVLLGEVEGGCSGNEDWDGTRDVGHGYGDRYTGHGDSPAADVAVTVPAAAATVAVVAVGRGLDAGGDSHGVTGVRTCSDPGTTGTRESVSFPLGGDSMSSSSIQDSTSRSPFAGSCDGETVVTRVQGLGQLRRNKRSGERDAQRYPECEIGDAAMPNRERVSGDRPHLRRRVSSSATRQESPPEAEGVPIDAVPRKDRDSSLG